MDEDQSAQVGILDMEWSFEPLGCAPDGCDLCSQLPNCFSCRVLCHYKNVSNEERALLAWRGIRSVVIR